MSSIDSTCIPGFEVDSRALVLPQDEAAPQLQQRLVFHAVSAGSNGTEQQISALRWDSLSDVLHGLGSPLPVPNAVLLPSLAETALLRFVNPHRTQELETFFATHFCELATLVNIRCDPQQPQHTQDGDQAPRSPLAHIKHMLILRAMVSRVVSQHTGARIVNFSSVAMCVMFQSPQAAIVAIRELWDDINDFNACTITDDDTDFFNMSYASFMVKMAVHSGSFVVCGEEIFGSEVEFVEWLCEGETSPGEVTCSCSVGSCVGNDALQRQINYKGDTISVLTLSLSTSLAVVDDVQ
eukprot:c6224_g1_i2.p1 GENE.c6224_g1_i2~~c6224_g1_i2.p1  ORF type:complete len:296 (+),score=67.98 c6224_g1_i2:699-1586(+)